METQAVWELAHSSDEDEERESKGYVKEAQGGQEHVLYSGENTIGRGTDQDIMVECESVSTRHAVIDIIDSPAGDVSITIKDLKSKNGTFVCGTRIQARKSCFVQSGDEISLGSKVFKVFLGKLSTSEETQGIPGAGGAGGSEYDPLQTMALPDDINGLLSAPTPPSSPPKIGVPDKSNVDEETESDKSEGLLDDYERSDEDNNCETLAQIQPAAIGTPPVSPTASPREVSTLFEATPVYAGDTETEVEEDGDDEEEAEKENAKEEITNADTTLDEEDILPQVADVAAEAILEPVPNVVVDQQEVPVDVDKAEAPEAKAGEDLLEKSDSQATEPADSPAKVVEKVQLTEEMPSPIAAVEENVVAEGAEPPSEDNAVQEKIASEDTKERLVEVQPNSPAAVGNVGAQEDEKPVSPEISQTTSSDVASKQADLVIEEERKDNAAEVAQEPAAVAKETSTNVEETTERPSDEKATADETENSKEEAVPESTKSEDTKGEAVEKHAQHAEPVGPVPPPSKKVTGGRAKRGKAASGDEAAKGDDVLDAVPKAGAAKKGRKVHVDAALEIALEVHVDAETDGDKVEGAEAEAEKPAAGGKKRGRKAPAKANAAEELEAANGLIGLTAATVEKEGETSVKATEPVAMDTGADAIDGAVPPPSEKKTAAKGKRGRAARGEETAETDDGAEASSRSTAKRGRKAKSAPETTSDSMVVEEKEGETSAAVSKKRGRKTPAKAAAKGKKVVVVDEKKGESEHLEDAKSSAGNLTEAAPVVESNAAETSGEQSSMPPPSEKKTTGARGKRGRAASSSDESAKDTDVSDVVPQSSAAKKGRKGKSKAASAEVMPDAATEGEKVDVVEVEPQKPAAKRGRKASGKAAAEEVSRDEEVSEPQGEDKRPATELAETNKDEVESTVKATESVAMDTAADVIEADSTAPPPSEKKTAAKGKRGRAASNDESAKGDDLTAGLPQSSAKRGRKGKSVAASTVESVPEVSADAAMEGEKMDVVEPEVEKSAAVGKKRGRKAPAKAAVEKDMVVEGGSATLTETAAPVVESHAAETSGEQSSMPPPSEKKTAARGKRGRAASSDESAKDVDVPDVAPQSSARKGRKGKKAATVAETTPDVPADASTEGDKAEGAQGEVEAEKPATVGKKRGRKAPAKATDAAAEEDHEDEVPAASDAAASVEPLSAEPEKVAERDSKRSRRGSWADKEAESNEGSSSTSSKAAKSKGRGAVKVKEHKPLPGLTVDEHLKEEPTVSCEAPSTMKKGRGRAKKTVAFDVEEKVAPQAEKDLAGSTKKSTVEEKEKDSTETESSDKVSDVPTPTVKKGGRKGKGKASDVPPVEQIETKESSQQEGSGSGAAEKEETVKDSVDDTLPGSKKKASRAKKSEVSAPIVEAPVVEDTPATTKKRGRNGKASAVQESDAVEPDTAVVESSAKDKKATKSRRKGSETSEESVDASASQQLISPCGSAAGKARRNSHTSSSSQPSLAGGEEIKICFTGVSSEKLEKKAMTAIGATEVQDVREATHLIAGGHGVRIKRTAKLMYGICKLRYILDVDWLYKSSEDKNLLERPEDFILHDKEAEKSFSFSLKESLKESAKLREEGKGILSGYSIHISPKVWDKTLGIVCPTEDDCKMIVEGAGGEWCADGQEPSPTNELIVISHPNLLKGRGAAAEKKRASRGYEQKAHTFELIFRACMRQKLEPGWFDELAVE